MTRNSSSSPEVCCYGLYEFFQQHGHCPSGVGQPGYDPGWCCFHLPGRGKGLRTAAARTHRFRHHRRQYPAYCRHAPGGLLGGQRALFSLFRRHEGHLPAPYLSGHRSNDRFFHHAVKSQAHSSGGGGAARCFSDLSRRTLSGLFHETGGSHRHPSSAARTARRRSSSPP